MNLPSKLEHALSQPLPGRAAQNIMAPTGRNLTPFEHRYSAAVLVALYQQGNQWRFPLIKRVEDGFAHSGQIGFPGGRIEADETPVETALREAEEEIGLKPALVRLIGQLSQLPIPVSKFLVYPVVGIIAGQPEWKINRSEVDSVFTVAIEDILEPENVKYDTWQLSIGTIQGLFFHLYGHKVWGATAMILSEFKAIVEDILH